MAEIDSAYKKAFPQIAGLSPGEQVILPVRVKAGARHDSVSIERDEQGQACIRVAVTPSPEKGKANIAVCKLLAKELGVPKSAVQIVKGGTSPQKLICVTF